MWTKSIGTEFNLQVILSRITPYSFIGINSVEFRFNGPGQLWDDGFFKKRDPRDGVNGEKWKEGFEEKDINGKFVTRSVKIRKNREMLEKVSLGKGNRWYKIWEKTQMFSLYMVT